MSTIANLVVGPRTPDEMAVLESAAARYQDPVIEKIARDGAAIRFADKDELPPEWPLGASAVNLLQPDGKNAIWFLKGKFNRGRAIHELFHAYDWKKTQVNGKAVWQSTSESDPRVREMHANYRRNFEHDFMKNVAEVLNAQHVLPGAWYPVALRVMEAMHYPYLASGLRALFSHDQEAGQSSLAYFLVRRQGDGIEAVPIAPREGEVLQRVYRDAGSRTFEIPEWRKVAMACNRQARSYPLDFSKPDRRFSEYAYLNDVREYTAEGAKFFMDTPETRETLRQSDPDLLNYLQSLKIAKS